MNSDRQFHPFSRLPVEIQLMIWSFYNDEHPGIRHCFTVKPSGRVYATFYEDRREYVNREGTHTGSPKIRSRRKVRPAGKVEVLDESRWHPKSPPCITLVRTVPERRPTVIRAPLNFLWFNFDHDVFYFIDSQYPFQSGPTELGYARKGFFRFLSNTIGREIPPALDNNHWIFRVRKLALKARPTPDLDLDMLSRLKQLEQLFIVGKEVLSVLDDLHKLTTHNAAQYEPDPVTGFITLTDFPELSEFSPRRKTLIMIPEIAMQTSLVKLFKEHHMRVEVEIVVNAYEDA